MGIAKYDCLHFHGYSILSVKRFCDEWIRSKFWQILKVAELKVLVKFTPIIWFDKVTPSNHITPVIGLNHMFETLLSPQNDKFSIYNGGVGVGVCVCVCVLGGANFILMNM